MSGGQEYDPVALLGADRGVIRGASSEYPFELRDSTACSRECPAGVNVKAYINLIANRRFEDAVEVIRLSNPFPMVCGRVCTRPCEEGCEQEGDPLAIRALKRFASDYELARRPIDTEPCEIVHDERIGVIGSGPAGLTAAVDLVRLGYPVTVYESSDEPGGMLRFGIPPNRLPKRVLKREIDWIRDLGVGIETGVRVANPADLLSEGHSAVLIAGGAPVSMPLGIDGEDAEGVIDALTFLRGVNSGGPIGVEGDVLVIGGGSTAFDAARSALRLGADSVTLAYRRGREEMPAAGEEVDEAVEEGVVIRNLAIPSRIHTDGANATGMEFIEARLGEPDASGRRRPVPTEGSEFTIDAALIIPAIGARPDVGPVGVVDVTTDRGTVEVDAKASTAVEGVFAAGDVELGPSSVVESIGRGHTAAAGIDAFLRGGNVGSAAVPVPVVLEPLPNVPTCYRPETYAHEGFEETERTMPEHTAVSEASRCVSCGPCHLCETCLPTCDSKQVAAGIDGTSFLLKVPARFSREVHKGLSGVDVVTDAGSVPIELRTLTVSIDQDRCIGCGLCEEACAYRAIGTVLRKGAGPVAVVTHDACASCSACVSSCPTGAISQGPMSDDELLERISSLSGDVTALATFWNTPEPLFCGVDGVVDIMAEFKPTVSFLIRALARSGRGVVLIGPDGSAGSHYITRGRDPGAVVSNAGRALAMVGISPDRIGYVTVPAGTDPAGVLRSFEESLDGLGPIGTPVPAGGGPVAEAFDALRAMASSPDAAPMDPLRLPAAEGGAALFEGCAPILAILGSSDGLFDMTGTGSAVRELVSTLHAVDGSISLSCPTRNLRSIEGGGEACARIDERNRSAVRDSGVSSVVVGSPEAFRAFSEDIDLGVGVASLPDAVRASLDAAGLTPLDLKVAVHPSCGMDEDPFLGPVEELLRMVPGVEVVRLEGGCGGSGIRDLTIRSREASDRLLSEAVRAGADAVVCTSPHCQARLLLMQRGGSWRTVEIDITDVCSLILRSLRGEGA